MAVPFPNQFQIPRSLPQPAPRFMTPQAGMTSTGMSNINATNQANQKHKFYPTPPEFMNMSNPVPQWQPQSQQPQSQQSASTLTGQLSTAPWNQTFTNSQLTAPMEFTPDTIRRYGGQPSNTPINQTSNTQPTQNFAPHLNRNNMRGSFPPSGTMTQTQSQQMVPGNWQTTATGNNPTLWQQTPVAPVQSVGPNTNSGGTSGLTLNLGEAIGTSNVSATNQFAASQPAGNLSLMAKSQGPRGLRLNTLA